jgi:hypothetical protein
MTTRQATGKRYEASNSKQQQPVTNQATDGNDSNERRQQQLTSRNGSQLTAEANQPKRQQQ